MFIDELPQIVIMVAFILGGVISGVVRFCFKRAFLNIKKFLLLRYVLDFIFSVFAGMLFIFLLVKLNFGIFRIYCAISFAFGMIFEYFLLELPLQRLFLLIYNKVKGSKKWNLIKKK